MKSSQTLRGSFSAVSIATIATKYSFCKVFRDLQDLQSFAPLRSQNFNKNSFFLSFFLSLFFFFFFSFFFLFFFNARIGRKIIPEKKEKVGPFECDVLEKQSRVSARCYPLTVRILHNGKRKRTPKRQTNPCPYSTDPGSEDPPN